MHSAYYSIHAFIWGQIKEPLQLLTHLDGSEWVDLTSICRQIWMGALAKQDP